MNQTAGRHATLARATQPIGVMRAEHTSHGERRLLLSPRGTLRAWEGLCLRRPHRLLCRTSHSMPAPDLAWAYPLLFKTHVSLVAGSLPGHAWPLRALWRHLRVVIDTARSRALFLLAALLCLAFMASVALARRPLGGWAP